MLFQISLKNGCNNFYLRNRLFKITLKPNSYLTSFFCHGLVNPSTLTFPNINLRKTVENLYVVSNVTEKSCINLYLLKLKVKFISDVKFSSWPGKSVNPNFWQYQSEWSSDKFICCLEIQSKNAEIISISTLNPARFGFHCIFNWVLSGFQTSVRN